MEDIEKATKELAAPAFDTKHRIFWGLASFGGALISGTYASLQSIFFTDYLGLVGPWAYLMILYSVAYALWNAINDPLFGIWSDRARLKGGRRIPFMRYTAPFLGIFFVLIWFAPESAPKVVIFWWMLITTFLYDTAYTIIFLVYSALLPELTENEIERNKLSVFASFFNLLGTIFGILLPGLLLPDDIVNFITLLPLRTTMIILGVIGAILVLFTTYKFKERGEFHKTEERLGFIDSIKYTFKNKSFLILVSANFMSIFIQQMLLGSIFYLADYIMFTDAFLLQIALFLPLLIGIWLTPKLSAKFGVVRADQILLVIGATGLLTIMFFPPSLLYISLAIAGIGLVGPLVLTNVMWGQVADEDELKTGKRREGVYFGMNALVTKPAQSVALAIPVILLTLANFVPRADGGTPETQVAAVYLAIRIFIGLIPAIALYIEVFILQLYPLKGEYWEKVQEEVLELHGEKKEKLRDIERSGG
ncbi:MAG: conserved membrane protein of unknown function [Promethearchaeota archaeon]|nr:MAG: conserved membrane protein of unknown function [Candidatus Lokiarchaeota archaeon]